MTTGPRPASDLDAGALEDIVSTQAAGVLIVDSRACVRFANPAAGRLLGVEPQELVGEELGFPLVTDGVTDLNVPGSDGSVRTVAMQVRVLGSDGDTLHVVTLFDVSGRARRYEHEHRLVESLQRSLLLREMPVVPGVALAARYLPGSREAEVGGDWYDAIPLSRGRLGLAIGDVAGHGIESAALMGQLRNALRAYALEDHSPATVLERLDLLLLQLEPDRTATLSYLIYDPVDGRLAFACAGHPPPLVVHRDGEVEFLRGGRSLPLGTGGEAGRPQETVHVPVGSSLVLYTDGLVERRTRPLDQGLARLAATAREAGGSPDDICDALLSRLFDESTADDDTALLVARTTPVEVEELELTLPGGTPSMPAIRRMLDQWLAYRGADEQERREIVLACHEACANVLEHAYSFEDSPYDLRAHQENGSVVVRVIDRGRWHPPPLRRDDDRGRGFLIMRAMVDEVTVNTGALGTTVVLRRALRRPRASR